MHLKRSLLWILCITLLLGTLSACAQEVPQKPLSTESDAPVDTSPVEPVETVDAEALLASAFDIPVRPEAEFVYTAEGDGVCVTGYTGNAARVRIPAKIGEKTVVAIGDGAFAENTALTALILPESVERLGTGILAGCSALNALHTPLLGESAEKAQYLGYLFGSTRFEDNPRDVPQSLKTLRLGGAWEKLPAFALYDCNDLTLVSLPRTVHTLEKFSLSRCESITFIDGLSSVRVLGEHALSYCESLGSISFGADVASFGFACLEGCNALRTLTVPFVGGTATENTYLGYLFGASYPDFSKGYYPPTLSRVEVLGGNALGTNAFYECSTLKEIVLHDGLETLGVRAFFGCTSLWSVTLPDTVKTVRESAFAGCDALLEIQLGSALTSMGINAFLNCDSLREVVLPASLEMLPASAFAGCSSLARVDLGGVRTVGAQAFRGCSSLTEARTQNTVEIGEGNDYLRQLLER